MCFLMEKWDEPRPATLDEQNPVPALVKYASYSHSLVMMGPCDWIIPAGVRQILWEHDGRHVCSFFVVALSGTNIAPANGWLEC